MTPEQSLHDAIEGAQAFEALVPEQRRLVRLAWDVRRLEVAGPGEAALGRMAARFDLFLAKGDESPWQSWLAAWLGKGGMPRPVVQRLAAAGLLLGAAGFGGAAATGTSPVEALAGVAHFAANAIENLTPRGGSGNDPITAVSPSGTVTASPTATPPADGPPSPQQTGSAGLEGTPSESATPAASAPGAASTATPSTPAAPTSTPTPSAGNLIPPTTAKPSASPGADDPGTPENSPTAAPTTPSPGPTQTPSATPTHPATPTPTASDGFTTQSYSAGSAGSVVLRYSQSTIEVVSVVPTAGWKYDVSDVEDFSLKVEFESNGEHVVFHATLENGVAVTSFTEDSGEGESGD